MASTGASLPPGSGSQPVATPIKPASASRSKSGHRDQPSDSSPPQASPISESFVQVSTPEEWTAYVDRVLAQLRDSYTFSSDDEQEIRANIMGRSRQDFTTWIPSGWNPMNECIKDLRAIMAWKAGSETAANWDAHRAENKEGVYPPQIPLKGAVLACLGVMAAGQSPSFGTAKNNLETMLTSLELHFVLSPDSSGVVPEFWEGLDMDVDFDQRPSSRRSSMKPLVRRIPRFMTRAQGYNHRVEVARKRKWIDPLRNEAYSSPTGQDEDGDEEDVPPGPQAGTGQHLKRTATQRRGTSGSHSSTDPSPTKQPPRKKGEHSSLQLSNLRTSVPPEVRSLSPGSTLPTLEQLSSVAKRNVRLITGDINWEAGGRSGLGLFTSKDETAPRASGMALAVPPRAGSLFVGSDAGSNRASSVDDASQGGALEEDGVVVGPGTGISGSSVRGEDNNQSDGRLGLGDKRASVWNQLRGKDACNSLLNSGGEVDKNAGAKPIEQDPSIGSEDNSLLSFKHRDIRRLALSKSSKAEKDQDLTHKVDMLITKAMPDILAQVDARVKSSSALSDAVHGMLLTELPILDKNLKAYINVEVHKALAVHAQTTSQVVKDEVAKAVQMERSQVVADVVEVVMGELTKLRKAHKAQEELVGALEKAHTELERAVQMHIEEVTAIRETRDHSSEPSQLKEVVDGIEAKLKQMMTTLSDLSTTTRVDDIQEQATEFQTALSSRMELLADNIKGMHMEIEALVKRVGVAAAVCNGKSGVQDKAITELNSKLADAKTAAESSSLAVNQAYTDLSASIETMETRVTLLREQAALDSTLEGAVQWDVVEKRAEIGQVFSVGFEKLVRWDPKLWTIKPQSYESFTASSQAIDEVVASFDQNRWIMQAKYLIWLAKQNPVSDDVLWILVRYWNLDNIKGTWASGASGTQLGQGIYFHTMMASYDAKIQQEFRRLLKLG